MSIKLRLVISYLAMLIIPIVLTVIVTFAILAVQFGSYSRELGYDGHFLQNMTEQATKAYMDIESAMNTDPDKLLDTAWLDGLDSRLSIMNAGIAIKKGDTFIYTSKYLNNPDLFKQLAKQSRVKSESGRPLIAGKETYSYITRDFNFKDKSQGTLYYILGMGPLSSFMQRFIKSLGMAILIIVMLTNGVITYLVSRSILGPLRVLKYGTGQIKNGNLNFSVKCDSKDEIGQVCAAFEDMRVHLKGSIDMQLQVEENRKELVSSISHDLKTPITSIKGYVEGILDGVADTPEKMDRYIRTIYTKAADMDRLIDDLFLYSKLDLKKLPFDFENMDIVRYLEDCGDELRLDLGKKDIELELDLGKDEGVSEPGPGVKGTGLGTVPAEPGTGSVSVVADREKLKRVIMNVIENSVKYMTEPQGKILIRLTESQDRVSVEIKDNGPGIEPEELPFIFDRFYRADRSRNSSTGGSGLGLAIAKQIIEGHGGDIRAESQPGHGTSIIFTLKKAAPGKSTDGGAIT